MKPSASVGSMGSANRIDEDRYTIRASLRGEKGASGARSNIRRVQALTNEKRNAARRAQGFRSSNRSNKSAIYSYEQRS